MLFVILLWIPVQYGWLYIFCFNTRLCKSEKHRKHTICWHRYDNKVIGEDRHICESTKLVIRLIQKHAQPGVSSAEIAPISGFSIFLAALISRFVYL